MEAEEVGDVCTQMAEKQLDSAVTVYLRKVYTHQDITPMMKVRNNQYMFSVYFMWSIYHIFVICSCWNPNLMLNTSTILRMLRPRV